MELGFNCEIQIFTKNIPLGEKKSNLDFLRQKKTVDLLFEELRVKKIRSYFYF